MESCATPLQTCTDTDTTEITFESDGQNPTFIVVEGHDPASLCAPLSQRCQATGGTVNACGSPCGPATCKQPIVPAECPGGCKPQCDCPDHASMWQDGWGCRPTTWCAEEPNLSPCPAGTFTLEIALEISD